jgi:hypothetical protein
MRLATGHRGLRRIPSLAAGIVGVALPLACTPSPPARVDNPFIGDWVTTEDAGITIGPDTVIQHQSDGRSTALDSAACGGVFRFTYVTKSRQTLTDLVPRQPDLRQQLSQLLTEPAYPVAELDCDRGDQTYVLVNDGELLAIYRDGDIAAIERLARR